MNLPIPFSATCNSRGTIRSCSAEGPMAVASASVNTSVVECCGWEPSAAARTDEGSGAGMDEGGGEETDKGSGEGSTDEGGDEGTDKGGGEGTDEGGGEGMRPGTPCAASRRTS